MKCGHWNKFQGIKGNKVLLYKMDVAFENVSEINLPLTKLPEHKITVNFWKSCENLGPLQVENSEHHTWF